MENEIKESSQFCRTHLNFLQGLAELLKKFAVTQEQYIVSNKFICEFIENYEGHNLQGYNSGGYAYLESQFKNLSTGSKTTANQSANVSRMSNISPEKKKPQH